MNDEVCYISALTTYSYCKEREDNKFHLTIFIKDKYFEVRVVHNG